MRNLCLGRCLVLLAVGVVVLVAAAPGARAESCRQRNYVNSLGLVLGVNRPIRATSSNNDTYDGIETSSFKSEISVDLCFPGSVSGVVLHLDACSGHGRGCDDNPIMYQEFPLDRDFLDKRRDFLFDIPPRFPHSEAGRRILAACNTLVDEARGAANDIPVGIGGLTIDVTLGVETYRDDWGFTPKPGVVRGIPGVFRPLIEYSKTKIFSPLLNVACAPLPPKIEEVKQPKVTEAALGVATSGDTCPKPATADVIIAAEAPRPVSYKIERGNGTTTTHDWIGGRIRMQKGPTGSESTFLRAEHDLGGLDPGARKFRLWIDGWGKTPWREVEVDCPPFKVISAWLKYQVGDKLTCPKNVTEVATFKATRPGKAPFAIKTKGGLVVHSGTTVFEREGMGYVATVERPNLSMSAFDSDMMALIKDQPDANSGWVRLKVECLEVLSGTLDLRSFADSRCEGEATLSIRTSMADNVPYQLDCTGGRSWSGTAQSQHTGLDTYVGVDTLRFEVANKEHINCALKTRAPLPVKVLALKGRTYACHRPSGVTGTSDLAPETRPDPQGSRGSRVVVDTPRACPQGTVGKWPNCRKQACPRGTVGSWPECKKRDCPRGTVGEWPNCRKQACPAGTVGKWPECKKLGCPLGQVRVRGRCIKPAG